MAVATEVEEMAVALEDSTVRVAAGVAAVAMESQQEWVARVRAARAAAARAAAVAVVPEAVVKVAATAAAATAVMAAAVVVMRRAE